MGVLFAAWRPVAMHPTNVEINIRQVEDTEIARGTDGNKSCEFSHQEILSIIAKAQGLFNYSTVLQQGVGIDKLKVVTAHKKTFKTHRLMQVLPGDVTLHLGGKAWGIETR